MISENLSKITKGKALLLLLLIFSLFLSGCIQREVEEYNSIKSAKQPTIFEPIKIYKACKDTTICYVKAVDDNPITIKTFTESGMWCTRDKDLVDKYCTKEEIDA